MRIGIDARFVGPQGTGIGVYTENLIKNLQKIDKHNQYFIFLHKNNWSHLKFTNKKFTKVLADISWYSLEEQTKLSGIFKSQNLDLLHVPHFNVPIIYRGKFIVTIHDLIHHHFPQTSATTKNFILFKLKRAAYHRIFKNAITKSKKIIVPSNFVKEDLIKTFKIRPQKIVVTYEAAEDEYFTDQRSTINDQRSTIIYVGNAYPHKNINLLLNAFKISNLANITTLKLILVIPRNVFSDRLLGEIKNRNLQDKIEILNYKRPSELIKLFQNSQAYIFPSLAEGFGIPGLNAKVPLLCSNIPVFHEIYGNAAFYFDPKDPHDLASKIEEVLIVSRTKEKLIKEGNQQVKIYSWLKMAKETSEVYQSA